MNYLLTFCVRSKLSSQLVTLKKIIKYETNLQFWKSQVFCKSNDFGIKVVLYDLGWPLRSYFILSKICFFKMLTFLKSFFKDWALNKKKYHRKDYFEILRWRFVTLNHLWGHIILFVFIEMFVKIDAYTRKKKAKIPESLSHGVF